MRTTILFPAFEDANDDSKPLFMYLSTLDLHNPATPLDRYKCIFADKQLPKPPSFTELDECRLVAGR